MNCKELIAFALFMILIVTSFSDKGFIVNPDYIVKESKQIAIVAFNKTHEAIILSTKLEGNGSVIELIPLPSLPTKIEEVNSSVFERLSNLLKQKSYKGIAYKYASDGEVIFTAKIGVHNITIVNSSSISYIESFMKNLTKKVYGKEVITDEVIDGVIYYLKHNITYFVFDVVEVKNEEIKPILYLFKSDYLFYPIKLTSLTSHNTFSTLSLFLITYGEINFSSIDLPIYFYYKNIGVSKKDLKEVNKEIASMFSYAYLSYSSYYDYITKMDFDIKIEKSAIKEVSYFERLNKEIKLFFVNSPFGTLTTYMKENSFLLSLLLFFLFNLFLGIGLLYYLTSLLVKKITKGKIKKLRKNYLIAFSLLTLFIFTILFVDFKVNYFFFFILFIAGLVLLARLISKAIDKIKK